MLTIGVNIAPMPLRSSRRMALAAPKRAKLSGQFVAPAPKLAKLSEEFVTPAPARTKLLEKIVTPAKSTTSQFLIDKNLPILTLAAPATLLHPSPPAAISNRNTKKLKSPVSHRKQSTGSFLIATFRAFSSPEHAHFALRFHATLFHAK